MDRDKKPRLTLIRGGGESTNSVPRSLIAFEGTSRPRAGEVQLELGAVVPERACIISLGLEGIEYHEFRRILQMSGIRYLIDTRILAVFRGNGFRMHLVDRAFEELGVAYERIRELENPFSAGEIGAASHLDRYGAYLRGLPEILRDIARRAERGPLLLLGRSADHVASEREAIVREMFRLGLSFHLRVVRKEQSVVRITSWPIVDTSVPRAAEDRGGSQPRAGRRQSRSSRARQAGPQVVLPFDAATVTERK